MTPGEMLRVLDHALAPGRRGRHRLVLSAPIVLGEHGRVVRDPDGEGPAFGYTRRQCKRMRRAILAAAKADAEMRPREVPDWVSEAPSDTET